MAAIDWDHIPSDTYERMVACLLSHQNPDVRRIDGSGGDEGRDCQFECVEGLDVFEMKGFPIGRVGQPQRRQVERSLKRAAQLNPKSWTLITPVDPTPAEWRWFTKLRGTVGFPLEWRGLTWLDLEFAQRMFIADYYLGTSADEVVSVLRELQAEKGVLANGVPDAMERVNSLVSRANQIDPHYRFRIASDGKAATIEIVPAYAGAEIDRPITIEAQFQFDTKTKEGRAKEEEFRRALDFGVPAQMPGNFVPQIEVDAPAGLGGTLVSPEVSIGPGKPITDEPLDLVFTVIDPEGATVAEIEMHCIPQTSGLRGTILKGQDRSGYTSAEVTIDVTGRRFQIKFQTNWGSFVPHDFAPVAKFLNAYRTPNSVVVAQLDGSNLSEPFPCGSEIDIPNFIVEFARSLAVIQATVGVVREVRHFNEQDIANAIGGAEFLRGIEVEAGPGSGQVTVKAEMSADSRQQMAHNAMQLSRVVNAPTSWTSPGRSTR